ncbi:hypothetical protein DRH14_03960 [Candidatus Shapirobacteria bacterium]|nr:MAG: hypothetical protein DRH14_03960 [Candidatus Shapirobacteria bacterium]
MSKILELYQLIVDKLAGSEPIFNFCIANFFKPQTVYLGFKWEENPTEEDYPLIVLTSIDRVNKGDTSGCVSLIAIINLFIEVENDLEENELPSGVKTKKYKGVELIEEFRNLVEGEILKFVNIGCKIDIDGETDLINLHPFYKSTSEIIFEMKKIKRSVR